MPALLIILHVMFDNDPAVGGGLFDALVAWECFEPNLRFDASLYCFSSKEIAQKLLTFRLHIEGILGLLSPSWAKPLTSCTF
jgi:hypothetical protein